MCACATIAHTNLWNHVVLRNKFSWLTEAQSQKSRFIYKGIVTIFISDLSWYKQQFNTLKGFEFVIAFCWLANDLSCYVFSKNPNGKKTCCVKVVKNCCVKTCCSASLRGGCMFTYKWDFKEVKWDMIHFSCTLWNLRE